MTQSSGLTEQQQGQAQGQLRDSEVKVFVSGCYDILHGGHLEFWSQARALGTYLIVSFASDDVLAAHKSNRRSSIPTEHKKQLIGERKQQKRGCFFTPMNK
jgi:cytidyltransferase-like protein